MTPAKRSRRTVAGAAVAHAALLLLIAPASLLALQTPSAAIDSLANLGRLQEAAWLAAEQGDGARGQALLSRLDSILRTPARAAAPLSMDSQGVSFTFRLDHGHGVGSIFKVNGSDIFCPVCGTDREVGVYALDRLLGFQLTPLTVPARLVDEHGDTLAGSAMYFVHDLTSPRELDGRKTDRLRLFDAVIGNSDRHMQNWLLLPDGRVVAIDHNRAFEYRPESRPKSCWETEIDSIARPADLGRPFRRLRELPDDSLAAALQGLDPVLIARFLIMRPRVVDRIEQRIRQPDRPLPHDDCDPGRWGS
jgi:hypothetical protein